MKVRNGFVSNSSSSSFIIVNKTNTDLKLVDFAKENMGLLYEFKKEYGYEDDEFYSPENMIDCATTRDEDLSPGDNYVTYGDEDGDTIGNVYDYMLRDGGESKRFSWHFREYNR